MSSRWVWLWRFHLRASSGPFSFPFVLFFSWTPSPVARRSRILTDTPYHLYHRHTAMAPSAITPPPQQTDGLPSTEKLPTTRKIVIFSGKKTRNTATDVVVD
jgi:hypothetical protein